MKQIPFFPNQSDGTHCYQAALKMVLAGLTAQEPSFEELDRISGKREGKWSWPTMSLIWLMDNGFEIRLVEEFSYERFGKEGKCYLTRRYGREVAQAQAANSDLEAEQNLALHFASRIAVEQRIPDWEDMEALFQKGYLLICNVNAALLCGQTGYSGHFVVPVQIMHDFIVIHDPGLPPNPSFKVSREIFDEAWGYPTEREKNILAVRLKKEGHQKNPLTPARGRR